MKNAISVIVGWLVSLHEAENPALISGLSKSDTVLPKT